MIVSGANFEITPVDVQQALSQMESPKVLVCQLEILQETVLAALKEARALGSKQFVFPFGLISWTCTN